MFLNKAASSCAIGFLSLGSRFFLQAAGQAPQGYSENSRNVTVDNFHCRFLKPVNQAKVRCGYFMPSPNINCLQLTEASGTISPLVCSDGSSNRHIFTNDFYVGDDLQHSKKSGVLQASFHLEAFECLTPRCNFKTRNSYILVGRVGFQNQVPVLSMLPSAEDAMLYKEFSVGQFQCLAEMFHYRTGTFTEVPLADGADMPADTDLHIRISCPGIPDDLAVFLAEAEVSSAGGTPVSLFLSPCQTHRAIYSIKYNAGRQAIVLTQDTIEGRDGRDTVQNFVVAVLPAAHTTLSARQLSTTSGQPCHDTIDELQHLVNQSIGHRGLQTGLPSGTVKLSYSVDSSRSFNVNQESHLDGTAASLDLHMIVVVFIVACAISMLLSLGIVRMMCWHRKLIESKKESIPTAPDIAQPAVPAQATVVAAQATTVSDEVAITQAESDVEACKRP